MAIARGFEVIAGVGAETTSAYNTEVAVTQKIRLLNETMKRQYTHIPDVSLVGNSASGPPDQGQAQIGGGITIDWDYTADELMLQRFFGTFTTGATSASPNTYNLANNQDDLGLSVAFDKLNEVYTFTGVKFHSLAMTGAAGEAVQITYDGFAAGESIASATNTTTVLGALAAPAKRVLFHHCADAFFLGDQADALTTADAIKPNAFSLTVNRNAIQFWTNAQLPEQSRENDLSGLELSITLPVYESTAYHNWHVNHTPLQALITFTNAADTNVTKIIEMPNLYITDAPVPIAGPALVPQTITLTGHHDLAGINTATTVVESIEMRETI